MKFNRETWLGIFGALWLLMGIWLLTLGMHWITAMGLHAQPPGKILAYFASFTGSSEQGTLLYIMLAFLVGFAKGRLALGRVVKKFSIRLAQIPEPISFSQIQGWRYVKLIGFMMLLGFCMKWFRLPLEIRGFVDVAVGSALINGASLYVRTALHLRKSR